MSAATLERSMDDLAVSALRVKAERDEAMRLLRESLTYRETGSEGPFKTKVRAFLKRTGEAT